MNFPVYAVRDSYIGFGLPLIRDNDSVASRAFEYDVTRDDSPFMNRPECYQLYHIGYFDTESGIMDSCTPVVIASAVDFVRKDD